MAEAINIVDPRLVVVDSSAGQYDGCHRAGGPLFWVYLQGHVRSFGLHANNFRSFLAGSSRCWFVVLYTCAEITSKFDPSRPWSENTDSIVARLEAQGVTVAKIISGAASGLHPSGSGSNVAWLSARRSGRSAEQLRAVVLLGRAVAVTHGIPRRDGDVIAVSRPDIVFSHAIDVPRIFSVMAAVPHVLMPHHDAEEVGGNDPSEMLVVGPRKFYEESCAFESGAVAREPLNQTYFQMRGGCLYSLRSCGWFAGHFIHAAYALNFMPFFYFGPIKLHLHRLSGHFDVGVMTPLGDVLPAPDSNVRGTLDITRGARCVVGETSACVSRSEAQAVVPPKSRCWGETRWVGINPGSHAGLWVCKSPMDIDGPC